MDIDKLSAACTRRELLAAGYTPSDLRRALRAGVVVRLADGVFAPRSFLAATPEFRHAQLSIATARDRSGALARVSAAAVHGLPIWGLRTDRVHMSSSERGRSGTLASSRLVTHADPRPAALVQVAGVEVVSVARTVVDIARSESKTAAIVVGDAVLHLKLCTRADLQAELDLTAGFPGHSRAVRAIVQMNGLSESPLESRSRVLIADDPHTPTPDVQVDVFDDFGEFLARGDLLWRDQRVIGECDGRGKYRGQYGVDPATAVIVEKERTDLLHEAGWRVLRWGSRDLEHPDRLIGRIRRMLTAPALGPDAAVRREAS